MIAKLQFRGVSSSALGLALAGLLLAAAGPSAADTTPALKLEKSVLFLRHGIRSPNQSPAELTKSSTRPWPEWPVAPGELTEHGAAMMRSLGGYYRQRYAAEGLLPTEGCPEAGSIAAWANNGSRRIPQSAQALLDGLAPGCELKAGTATAGGTDPVFHPTGAAACPAIPRKAVATILRAADGDLSTSGVTRKVRPGLKRLQEILQARVPGNCAHEAHVCGLDEMANDLVEGPDGAKLEGSLKLATTVGENFLLEYMEGFPERDIAWGEATTVEALAPMLGPRNLYLRLLNKTPYVASHAATPLARAVLAALDDETGADPASATRLMAFVGRDIELAALAGLLGLDWSLPGQPDNHGPGVTLAFERLLNAADGKRYVRARLYYQTADQLRSSATLDLAHPAQQLALKIPGCDKDAIDGACPLPKLRSLVQAAYANDCTAP